MSTNPIYTFQLHYSQEYKLFDLVIKKDNKFYKHYHLEDLNDFENYIKNYPNEQ